MLCFVAKEAASLDNGIGSFFEIQIMDWVFRFKPTWYLKKQANLPVEKGFYFVIKIIFILISVNHHFLSNQIHKSFHNLYYVPFCDNNCNIPLSVLCILQWKIFSVKTIKSESIIAVFQYYVLYVFSLLACSTGRLNTPAGPVSGSRVGGRETTSANTKRNTKRNTRRYTNTEDNREHTFLFWMNKISQHMRRWMTQ